MPNIVTCWQIVDAANDSTVRWTVQTLPKQRLPGRADGEHRRSASLSGRTCHDVGTKKTKRCDGSEPDPKDPISHPCSLAQHGGIQESNVNAPILVTGGTGR